MPSSRSSYRLKRFLSSKDPDFAAALLIYIRYTPPNIRADSNEITYWLDRFSNVFDDKFYVFGFYRNRHLVGFAQAAYFQKEYLFFIDYMTIDERHRGNNVFFEFVQQLKDYLENAHPEYRYGVTEVAYEPGQQHPSPTNRLLIRLLKFQGFRVIHAPYFQPRLMMDDSESELGCALLIYRPTALDSLRGETYLSIIRTIYYKHYLRWKAVEPTVQAKYEKHIDTLFSKIQAKIKTKQNLVVNGYREVLSSTQKAPIMTVHRIVSFALQALTVVILVTTAMLGLKWAFGLSNTSFAAIYGLAISSFVALAGIVSKEARAMFGEFASLAKYFFGRKETGLKPNELESGHSSKTNPSDL